MSEISAQTASALAVKGDRRQSLGPIRDVLGAMRLVTDFEKVSAVEDLVQQHVLRSPVLHRRTDVPVTDLRVGDLLQQDADVPQGNCSTGGAVAGSGHAS